MFVCLRACSNGEIRIYFNADRNHLNSEENHCHSEQIDVLTFSGSMDGSSWNGRESKACEPRCRWLGLYDGTYRYVPTIASVPSVQYKQGYQLIAR